MKIGCTVGYKDLDKIAIAAKAGYDYVEVALNRYATCSREEREAFRKELSDNNIPCEAANCLFPGNIKLCDESFNEKEIADYLEKAFAIANETGIDTVVFGSGASRTIAEGFPKDKALRQIEIVCKDYLDPIGAKYGITVVIEPLNKGECNIFNTVEESAAFTRKLGLKNVMCLADTYHMDVEKEPYTNVLLAKGILCHTHIANPDGRVVPLESDVNDYTDFFASLRKIDYKGRLTIEAGIPKNVSMQDALTQSLSFLRKMV